MALAYLMMAVGAVALSQATVPKPTPAGPTLTHTPADHSTAVCGQVRVGQRSSIAASLYRCDRGEFTTRRGDAGRQLHTTRSFPQSLFTAILRSEASASPSRKQLGPNAESSSGDARSNRGTAGVPSAREPHAIKKPSDAGSMLFSGRQQGKHKALDSEADAIIFDPGTAAPGAKKTRANS